MSAAQLLRQAEALKAAVADTSRAANESWVSRQSLQDIYQKLLVIDLEFALDKKVEQDLWNHAFKNQISTLQNQVRDKTNPKRAEIQASLNLFLETASGFYLQLLQELCSAFRLDLPCRRKASHLGILQEYGPVVVKMRAPKRSSCHYICQHCLVHLGDIARYRQQIEQAQTYYRHAANLVPYNGQPYNQLAILEAAKGNKLSTVFYYIRSIAVKYPFLVASTNLEKFYTKISKEKLDFKGKLSMSDIVTAFLQLHAFIHLQTDYNNAKARAERLVTSLPTHITSMSFSSYQLIQLISINLYALHQATRARNSTHGSKVKQSDSDQSEAESKDGSSAKEENEDEKNLFQDVVFNLTVSVLDSLLQHTPKQESKAKEYHTLPAIKVIFDWLRFNTHRLSHDALKNPTIWSNLSKLLNNLQFHANQKDFPSELERYQSVPLPEDCDLQCFLPIYKAYSELDFKMMPVDGLSAELEIRLRCHRLLEHGLWICEEFPSLNLLNVQTLKSGRLQFSAPAAQIRVLTGADDVGPDRKSYRQNVAIQAIMQNKAKKSSPVEPSVTVIKKRPEDVQKNNHKTEKENVSSSVQAEAPVMTHTGTDPQPLLHREPQAMPQSLQQPITIKPRMSNPAYLNQMQAGLIGGFVPEGGSGLNQPHPCGDQVLAVQRAPATQDKQEPQKQMFSNLNLGPIGVFSQQPTENSQPNRFPAASLQENLGPRFSSNFPSSSESGASGQFPGFQLPDPSVPPPPMPRHPSQPPSYTAFGGLNFDQQPAMSLQDLLNKAKMQSRQREPPKPSPEFPNISLPPPSSDFSIPGQSPLETPGGQPFQEYNRFEAESQKRNHQPAHHLTPGVPGPGVQYPHFPPPLPQARPSLDPALAQALLSQLFAQATAPSSQGSGDDAAQRTIDQRTYSMQSTPDSLLSPNIPPSSLMGLGFPFITEEVPKPDSPPTIPKSVTGNNELFSLASSVGLEPAATVTSTYSLFSQSPWLGRNDNTSQGASPFTSNSSSLRTTPDTYMPPDTNSPAFGGFSQTFSTKAHEHNWNTGPRMGAALGMSPNDNRGHRSGAGSTGPLPYNNMQTLWSAGPSPLEKLLEQQKHQRHGDPPH